jgi:C1A family cysteine protease
MTKISKSKRFYGWLPDVPDHRDHLYAAQLMPVSKLPAKIDLRPHCSPVYDQGELGSCTANALAGAMQYERHKQKLKPDFIPSRLFIYYNERVMENSVASDAGAQIRDGIKSIANQGDCPETEWPYDISKFTHKPGLKCYLDAVKYTAVQYQRVPQILNQMKGCLASGYPFVFGFSVYTGFETEAAEKSGEINMPGPKEKLLGGHAVVAVGYDDNSQRFIVRNSWGDGWGIKGYFTLPYAYLTDPNLADDLWTIRLESA